MDEKGCADRGVPPPMGFGLFQYDDDQRGEMLNAHKTYTRPLRFCLFSLIAFLYSNKKARISSLIVLRTPCEIPTKSDDRFLFSFYFCLFLAE